MEMEENINEKQDNEQEVLEENKKTEMEDLGNLESGSENTEIKEDSQEVQKEEISEGVSAQEFSKKEEEKEKKDENIEQLEQVGEVEVKEKPKTIIEPSSERRWYIVFAKSGYEHRVKAAIEERINTTDLGQKVFRVLVPEEEIVELHHNRRVERMKKMFPGYVFIEMILDDETWYKIRRIPGVSRFIGAHRIPMPVQDKEIQRVLRQIGMKEETLIETDFEKGEGIRIISGPFRGYSGTIDECYPDKGKLRAYISIFGRDTPVELDFSQVEKL